MSVMTEFESFCDSPASCRPYSHIFDVEDAPFITARACTPAIRGDKTFLTVRHNGRNEYLHRILANAKPGQRVIHRNGNGLDNRKSNLEIQGPGVPPDAIIDSESSALLSRYRWYKSHCGSKRYFATQTSGRLIYMHRLLTGARPGEIVDHINGNTLDNRLCNLRITDKSTNALNVRDRVRGVSRSRGNKWRAYGNLNGKQVWLGSFDSREEAISVATKWRRETFPAVFVEVAS